MISTSSIDRWATQSVAIKWRRGLVSRIRMLFPHAARVAVCSACCLLMPSQQTFAWQSAQVPAREVSARPAAGPDELISDVNDAKGEFRIILRRSKLIRTKHDVYRTAVAAPGIVEIVQYGPREIALIGMQTGTTTLTFWYGDKMKSEVVSYLVTVVRDPGEEDRRAREYGELAEMLNELFPKSKIQLIPIADKLVVRGEARDSEEVSQIMAIVRHSAVDSSGGVVNAGGYGAGIAQGAAATPFPDPRSGDQISSNIINMLRVPGEQQVMLKVRVAEISRTALRRLGVNFDFQSGRFFFQSLMGASGNMVATFDRGDVNTFIEALTSNGVMKILAEPNLVTLSGHTASFIAGGEFAVPTVVGVQGVGAATTQFRGFGTQLTFTPTVIDKDRIRLHVAPEFSALNHGNSVNGIPGLDTRAAVTTVDLREGQVLAIAGLLLDQQAGDKAKIPWFGDIPILGAIASRQKVKRDETELIVLVTPEIVHPMDPSELPGLLPGTDVTEPNDLDFYFGRRIEGRPDCQHRSTVWSAYQERVWDAKAAAKRAKWNAMCAKCAPACDDAETIESADSIATESSVTFDSKPAVDSRPRIIDSRKFSERTVKPASSRTPTQSDKLDDLFSGPFGFSK